MRKPTDAHRHDRLVAAALVWLLAGIVALFTTVVPVHSASLGWTGTFWAVLAPITLLLVLEPALPRQLLARVLRPRTRRATQAIWH
ncbi:MULTISPECIES: hypothetical protein [Dyella]|uniref:Uncharacterized protein n=2 Tax=Dyella TaxID=231454 RepID=A0A4R0YJB5_9GAMM|nr:MULTISPECIES: hypothetical protein [Dyella]TBR35900.1 hypothetical protein EYV96_18085 [Dyella terrae]TCI08552.1 hypothetical protein EZM97_28470 [Dyella soli]